MNNKIPHTLPNVSDSFHSTWDLTKLKVKRYFFWQVISFLSLGLLLLLGIILGIAVKELAIPLLILSIPLTVYLLTIQGYVSTLLVISEEAKNHTFKELVKQVSTKFIPLFLAFIFSIPFMGSFFLFFIPGIIVCFFISFAGFEILMRNSKPWQAILRSIAIWQTNSRYLLKHCIALFFASFVVNLPFEIFNSYVGDTPDASLYLPIAGVSIVQAVVSIFTTVFSIIYFYNLYKHTDGITAKNTKANIKWIWITSILGWLIFAFFFSTVAGLLMTYYNSLPTMLNNS